MNPIQEVLAQILDMVSRFAPNVGIFLFLICFIGEAFVISVVPLVLEAVWIAVGLNLTQGKISVFHLILMLLGAQLGRQMGAIILYAISRRGTSFFTKFIARRLPKTLPANGTPGKLLARIDSISPFGVALGRMLWIRVPLTLLLGARRKLKNLVLGIAISSLIYDGAYVALGAVGNKVIPESDYMLLYLLGGLVAFYLVVFGARFLYKTLKRRLKAKKQRGQQNDSKEAT